MFGICLILYLCGLVISLVQGSLLLYSSYIVIPAGIGGFGFVLGSLTWAHKHYSRLVWDLRLGFKSGYLRSLQLHWKRLTNPIRALWLEVPCTLAAAGYVLAVRAVRTSWDTIPHFSDWIAYGPLPLFCYLVVCAGLAGYVGSAGAYLILEHIRFLRALPKTPSNLRALMDREADLTQLARFSFYVSGTWFVGLAFVTVGFYHDVNPYTVTAYVVASLLGLAFFLLPQFYIHENITVAKQESMKFLRRQLPATWRESNDPVLSHDALAILNMIHEVNGLKDWPVEVDVILFELMAAAAPLLLSGLGSSLGLPL